MKKIISTGILFFAITIFFAGCKKDNSIKNENGQVLIQGNLNLKIQAKHHWWGVPYLPVYLKKNAVDWPGTDSTKYEFRAIADNDGYVQFSHLFPGNYFIYAHGYDAVFGMNVIGYHAVQLSSSSEANHEVDFTLNVSE